MTLQESDFPKPHIPDKLPINDIIRHILTDQDFLSLCFMSMAKFSEFIGYLQNLPNPNILVSSLTLQESVHSSKIEGTIATIADVINDSGTSETIKNDIVEIKNYVDAIKFGRAELKDRGYVFSKDLICTLHQILLTNNVRGSTKTPGKFKSEQNYILNDLIGNFTPLPPYLTDEYIENLVDYSNNFKEVMPLLQIAIIHAQFEMIHPFKDGNGRIGRLLIPLFLFVKKVIPYPVFYISRYFAFNEDNYKEALSNISKSFNTNNYENAWKDWFKFFLKGIIVETQKHITTSGKIISLHKEMINIVTKTEVIPIIDLLFDSLRISPVETMKVTKLNKTAVYNTLKKLEEKGYVKRTGSERKTTYIFSKILDII